MRSPPACATASAVFPEPLANLVELTKLRAIALRKRVTRVVVDEQRLTLGVGSGFELDPAAVGKLAVADEEPLPLRRRPGAGRAAAGRRPRGRASKSWMPLLRRLLEAI